MGVADLVLDAAELLVVLARDAHRIEHRRRLGQGLEEGRQFALAIVLVQCRRQSVAVERLRHFEGADRVHVGGDDGHAAVAPSGMAEGEFTRNVDFRARGQRRALGADQDVLEIELEFFFDAHGVGLPDLRRQGGRLLRQP
jgi:hypothetical protein